MELWWLYQKSPAKIGFSMKKESLQKVIKLDKELLDLLIKRTLLYSTYLRDKRKKNTPISDSEFEGRLWKIWSKKTKDVGINPKTLRTLYNHFNNLSYELAEKEEEKSFKLRPLKNKPVNINLAGPFDVYLTRFLIYISALKNLPLEIKHLVLNDAIYQLIKAFNALDSSFTWDRDLLLKKEGRPINFNKKVIFTGEDELNLYLLIFAAISQPGICKFTGDSNLKSMDLRPLFSLVSQMGARIAPLIPGSYGLPIRIEATGTINDTLVISEEVPDPAFWAFLISTIAYNLNKISISTPNRDLSNPFIDRIFFLFNKLGIKYQIENDHITLIPGLNYSMEIPHILDPELTAYLLGIVIICGGEADITGTYPVDFNDGAQFLKIFKPITPNIIVEKNRISIKYEKKKLDFLELDIQGSSRLLPLAVSLGIFANKAKIRGIPLSEQDNLNYVLTSLNINYELNKDTLLIYKTREKKDKKQVKIFSPTPNWSIALSLISLIGYEIVLENPGEITKLWPTYWTYFKSIPKITNITQKKEEDQVELKKTRRRFLISGDKKVR